MATVAAEPLLTAAPRMMAPPAKPAKTWLLSPWLDLLFLANLTWPLLALAAFLGAQLSAWDTSPVVQTLLFWQIYFLSTPHRWITLSLVFLDEERFQQRPVAYMGIGVFFILFVTAVVLGTGATLLLVAIDYFWNAWHFAAQHAGIARIYGRSCRPNDQAPATLEKTFLRVFILFVIFRAGAAACTVNCGENTAAQIPTLTRSAAPFFLGLDLATLQAGVAEAVRFSEHWLDFPILALPLFLLLREFGQYRPTSLGRLAYLGSVAGAYTALLLAVHYHHASILAVALAISLFHATEYLAIVSWAVIRKHGRAREGVFAHLVPRWGIALLSFMTILAISAWMIEKQLYNEWAVLTIAVSFLHYAYDGMIWKVRRPASAAA
jgi:hypothetical protein